MQSVQVINLKRHDSIETICEFIQSAAGGAQVWLVLGRWPLVSSSLLDLKRMRHVAGVSGVDLRVVSGRSSARSVVRDAGIPVYAVLPPKLWQLSREQGSEQHLARRASAGRAVELGAYWRRRPQRIGLGVVVLSLLAIVILLGAMAGAAILFVPSALVEISPISSETSSSFDVIANPVYRVSDYGDAIIPARVVQVIITGYGETPASGRLDVPDQRSFGEVVFVNRTTDAVTVPKGTIVRTSSGTNVRYYTVADITLNAALYAHERVGVIALDPGPASNARELTINIVEGDVATQVEVLNDEPTLGGSISRVPMVAFADFDRVRADLMERLQGEAYEQLVDELEKGEFIPPASVDTQVMAQYYDQVLDQQSDVLSMELKVVVRGLAVDGSSLDSFAGQLLTGSAGSGMALIDGTLTVNRVRTTVEGQLVYIEAQATGTIAPTIDEDAIKAGLRGKTITQSVEWLQQNLRLRTVPTVSIGPGFWPYMPYLPAKAEIRVLAGGS